MSEDFIIRQIYYPFRVWHNRITKPVRPVFFLHSNSIFSLYEYAFDDPHNYSSIRLIRHKNYSIDNTNISSQDIQSVLRNALIAAEPEGVPFPQADTFERVINLCELLGNNDLSKQEISEEYAFNEIQAYYYASAGLYPGLIEKNGRGIYSISKAGSIILKMSWIVGITGLIAD